MTYAEWAPPPWIAESAACMWSTVATGRGRVLPDACVDLIHIEGFSRGCFAWRKRTSRLIVSPHSLVQRHVEGSAVDVLNDVLTWEPGL